MPWVESAILLYCTLCAYICVNMCVHACVCVYVNVCVYVCEYVRVCVCMRVCVRASVCVDVARILLTWEHASGQIVISLTTWDTV